jgi:hypothetical protein
LGGLAAVSRRHCVGFHFGHGKATSAAFVADRGKNLPRLRAGESTDGAVLPAMRGAGLIQSCQVAWRAAFGVVETPRKRGR